MSMEQVSQIIGRALLDDGFREQLLNAPEQVLGEFDLTGQEMDALKRINADQLQKLNEAFQAQLGSAEPNLTNAKYFMKVAGEHFAKVEYSFLKWTSLEPGAEEMIPGRLKWDPGEISDFGNAWPSKVVPSSPAASTGLSLPAMLAISAVVVGTIAAGIFFFRSDDSPEEAVMDSQPVAQATQGSSQEEAAIYEDVVLVSSEDSMCLTGQHFHLCAVPAGQVADQLGDTVEDPVMLPLTPEQASLLISASGGSPPGVAGFTVMMLAGPDTYQIKLPDADAGNEAIFLSDAKGNLYFGSAAYFPNETATEEIGVSDVATGNSLAVLAGTWESISGAGTMTCEGASINIPPAPPEQIVFDENGQAVLTEAEADSSTAEITISSEGTFLATVTTVVEGDTIVGELEFTLITPDLIEGTYRANYEDICSFERPVTMNRLSGLDGDGGEAVAPLKPAEFSVESYFGAGDAFIPQLEICTVLPDSCMDGATPTESLTALLSGWGTFGGDVFIHGGSGGGAGKVNISNECDTRGPGTACVPAAGEGDAYIPPYPADAGWGSKGIGNPTLVSVLDVDAVGVINGIFDLWFVMGIPEIDDWDGIVGINSDNVRVYELDLETGQQSLWEEIKVTYDVVEITTDQNRLFVFYLFEDEASAQVAPVMYP